MERHFEGAAAVAVAVVLLLSSCGGQQPGSRGSDSKSWGTTPQQPPRITTAQPSAASSPSGPQPSKAFTPEQFEAANALVEHYHIRDAVPSDLDVDPQSLMDITVGQSQETQANRLFEFRGKGQVQTGTTVARTTGASEPVEFDGVRSVDVQMCTDIRKVDMVDSATGKSVVPVNRLRYLQWNVNVVKTEADWKFGDATNENALRCPT